MRYFLSGLVCVFSVLGSNCKPKETVVSDVSTANLTARMVWPPRVGRHIGGGRADCRVEPEDIFDPGGYFVSSNEATKENQFTFPTHRLAGQCVSSINVRPVIAIDASLLPDFNGTNNTHLVVANVKENDGYYTASVPKDSAKSANYLIEYFGAGGPVAHGMIRVFFSKDIKLYKQHHGKLLASHKSVRELIISVHAASAEGVHYDALDKGLANTFGLSWGLFTLPYKVADVVVRQKNPVEQIPLKLTPKQLDTILATYVKQSPDRYFTQSYNTFNANCGTELLYLLNQAIGVPPADSVLKGTVAEGNLFELFRIAAAALSLAKNREAAFDISPAWAQKALASRDLLDTSATPPPLLGEEPEVLEIIKNR